MTKQELLWIAAGAALVLALVAAVAERRRTRRTDINRVGWVPWNGVQVFAFFGAVAFGILAMKL